MAKKRAAKVQPAHQHDALVTTYAGLVARFAEKLPHGSATSTLASGIMAGVAFHKADPQIMERLAEITSDMTTWASVRKSARSFVEALRAADAVDAAARVGHDGQG